MTNQLITHRLHIDVIDFIDEVCLVINFHRWLHFKSYFWKHFRHFCWRNLIKVKLKAQ